MQSYSQNSQDERVQKRTARAVVYVASANDQAVLAKIHNTYSTSAYNFNWPVPRTHTCCFNLRIQVRISSSGQFHVLKTRMYTSTGPYHTYKYVRSTRFSLFEYVEIMCSRIRVLVDKSPKVYTQLAREGVVLTQDSDNI